MLSRFSLALVLLCAALPLGLGGCRALPPGASDLLEVGFRSPEQTFHTFRTAVSLDEIDLEYRCFSQYFREENGIDQLTYREFRAALLDELPFMRHIGQAQVLESRLMEPGVWLVRSRVRYLWKLVDFDVLLSTEDYYELYAGDQRATDGFSDFEEIVAVDGIENAVAVGFQLEEGLPPSVDSQDVTEVRVGKEWKISAFRVAEAD
jgi:hypothetical protein